jgi:hypothetical protein
LRFITPAFPLIYINLTRATEINVAGIKLHIRGVYASNIRSGFAFVITGYYRVASRRSGFLAAAGAADCQPQSVDLRALPAFSVLRLDAV